MRAAAIGVDVGSTTCKVVAVAADGAVIARLLEPTDPRVEAQVARMVAALGLGAGTPVGATGYGRGRVPAHRVRTEIACHAAGAFPFMRRPGVLLDMGGQDTKVIRLGAEGEVLEFAMNDKCAAGTGRFLELLLRRLKLPPDGAAARPPDPPDAVSISSTCAVFAETEVVSLLAGGHPPEAVAEGVRRALAARVASLVRGLHRGAGLFMSGGVAANARMVAALQETLGYRVSVVPDPQFVGALGAALPLVRSPQGGRSP